MGAVATGGAHADAGKRGHTDGPAGGRPYAGMSPSGSFKRHGASTGSLNVHARRLRRWWRGLPSWVTGCIRTALSMALALVIIDIPLYWMIDCVLDLVGATAVWGVGLDVQTALVAMLAVVFFTVALLSMAGAVYGLLCEAVEVGPITAGAWLADLEEEIEDIEEHLSMGMGWAFVAVTAVAVLAVICPGPVVALPAVMGIDVAQMQAEMVLAGEWSFIPVLDQISRTVLMLVL